MFTGFSLRKWTGRGRNAQLGILVWHHAVTGDRKVADTESLKRLAEAGYRILLHGGAHADDRPESTPRLYSLLDVARDQSEVRVIRRRQRTAEGPYEAYAIYRGPDENTKKADYTIPLAAGD